MHSIKNFKDFSFESATRFENASPSYTQATYTCQAVCSSGDLLASVLPVLPLLGKQSLHLYVVYVYIYIPEKKTF